MSKFLILRFKVMAKYCAVGLSQVTMEQLENRIVRLNSDGTLDSSFSVGVGFNDPASSVEIQSEGKILCGGNFTSYNGTTQNGIVRLNSDGTLDSSLSVGTGFNFYIWSIAIQNDSKILCGGSFRNYNGTNQNRIVSS